MPENPSSKSPESMVQRLGFMAGQITVPDDFDEMGHFEIKRFFEE
jgi:hypothetical protein